MELLSSNVENPPGPPPEGENENGDDPDAREYVLTVLISVLIG
jgi:hypothetical protein